MLAGSAYLEHQDQVLEMLLKFPRCGTHVMTRHEFLYPYGSYRHVHVHIYLLFRLLSCWQTLAHRVFSNLSCDWSCRASSAVLMWLMSTPAEFTLPSTASCSGISSVKSCAHNTDAVDYYWLIIYWFQVKIIDRDPGGIWRFPTVSLTLFNNKHSNLALIYRLYLCSYIFLKRKSCVLPLGAVGVLLGHSQPVSKSPQHHSATPQAPSDPKQTSATCSYNPANALTHTEKCLFIIVHNVWNMHVSTHT